jgi:hypothetical protein
MMARNGERRWWLVFLKYHRSKNKGVVLEEEDEGVSMAVVVLRKEVGWRRNGHRKWCYGGGIGGEKKILPLLYST